MAYGELEIQILELSPDDPVDLEAVQKIFDQGADSNAVDDWNEVEQEYEETLFTGCIFETPWDGVDMYPFEKMNLYQQFNDKRFLICYFNCRKEKWSLR